jgi:hypothetical protein
MSDEEEQKAEGRKQKVESRDNPQITQITPIRRGEQE